MNHRFHFYRKYGQLKTMYSLKVLMLVLSPLVILTPGRAAAVVATCEDGTKAVKLNLQFGKNANAAPVKAAITSDGKSKDIDPKSISRFIRNDEQFYVLFKVQTKVGPQEIELNARLNKTKNGAAGILTNKTQDERLPVSCVFGNT